MRSRHCKILATLGPASAAPAQIAMLNQVGVDAYRLNFSHGAHAEKAKLIEAIRQAEVTNNHPITIVADLQGPKLRTGQFAGGAITLKFGETVELRLSEQPGTADLIPVPHPELFAAMQPGDTLKLNDGRLQVTVTEIDGDSAKAKIDVGGELSNNKGINVIDRQLPITALTDKDRADLAFALDHGVDYVALSFVQRPEDVDDARELIGNRAGIIVKVEKPSAVASLDQIVERADAIMVARGDLGVELPPEEVPIIQRKIIRTCRSAGKPVIVATHMLESMIDQPTPTRAEASDVATAVYQGADAVMLSAESAVGRHPATAVAIMDRIIAAVEADPSHWETLDREIQQPEPTTADAISLSARHIAKVLSCDAIVAFTSTGSTALRIARDRPPCKILGLTPNVDIARRLTLAWGVRAVVTEDVANFDDMVTKAEDMAQRIAHTPDDERIIITAGIPFGRPGKTNTLRIARIGGPRE